MGCSERKSVSGDLSFCLTQYGNKLDSRMAGCLVDTDKGNRRWNQFVDSWNTSSHLQTSHSQFAKYSSNSSKESARKER